MNVSNLKIISITNTAYALIDIFSTKIGTTLAFVVLVRLLSYEEISVIGVGFGYVIVLSYFNLGTVRVLDRDFPHYSSNNEEFSKIISTVFFSWIIQTCIMVIAGILISIFIFPNIPFIGLTFLFWGLAFEFIALTFQEWAKVVFFASFKQLIATKINIIINFFKLSLFL